MSEVKAKVKEKLSAKDPQQVIHAEVKTSIIGSISVNIYDETGKIVYQVREKGFRDVLLKDASGKLLLKMKRRWKSVEVKRADGAMEMEYFVPFFVHHQRLYGFVGGKMNRKTKQADFKSDFGPVGAPGRKWFSVVEKDRKLVLDSEIFSTVVVRENPTPKRLDIRAPKNVPIEKIIPYIYAHEYLACTWPYRIFIAIIFIL